MTTRDFIGEDDMNVEFVLPPPPGQRWGGGGGRHRAQLFSADPVLV